MTLTPPQINSIARIIGMAPTLLNAHLTSLGTTLDAQLEMDVLAEVTRWSGGIGAAFTEFTPTGSNKGMKLSSKAIKADVRKNIRVLLEITDGYLNGSGMGTLCIGS